LTQGGKRTILEGQAEPTERSDPNVGHDSRGRLPEYQPRTA
jgi:hypothetical protein